VLHTENFSSKGQALISQYRKMAEQGYVRTDGVKIDRAFSDFELRPFRAQIRDMFSQHGIQSVLDYGAGGSDWQQQGFDPESGLSACQYFNLQQAWRYEPGRGLDERQLADAVVSFDVLEHVFVADVPQVLRDMLACCGKLLVLNVACYAAAATLPCGENAHVTVRTAQWWKGMLDAVAVEYPSVWICLITSRGWRQAEAFPPWRAQQWHEVPGFVVE
jgi:hypothetical protein